MTDALPDAPTALAARLGDRLASVSAFAEALATRGVERGLIGPREVPRLWERHIGNCAVVEELIPHGHHVVDVGSGGGLPGMVLALARPDLRLTLVEPMLRRTTWLSEISAELGASNVTVLRGRADEVRIDDPVDVVTSRAVAKLATLAGWCAPLVRPGGCVLALKGSSAPEEIAAARSTLHRLGVSRAEVVTCGGEVLDVATIVVRLIVDKVERRKDGRRSRT